MPPFSARTRAFEASPPVKRTLLSRAGTGLLDLIDVPQNVLFSGTRFIQTGEIDYLVNIAKNVSPFHEAEEISGESITGGKTSGTILNFVGDPLFFIAGLGALTIPGKALLRIGNIRAARRIAQLQGDTEKVAQFSKKIGELKKVVEKGKGKAKRSIVSVGLPFSKKSVPLGDFNKLRRSISRNVPIGLLPSKEKVYLLNQVQKIEAEIKVATTENNLRKIGELQESLTTIQQRLTRQKPTLPLIKTSIALRNLKQKGLDFFQHNLPNRLLEANAEAVETGIAAELSQMDNVTIKTLELLKDDAIEAIRKIEKLELGEIQQRFLILLEGRKFRGEGGLASGLGKIQVRQTFNKTEEKLIKRAVEREKKISQLPLSATTERQIAAKKSLSKLEDDIRSIKLERDIKIKQIDQFVEANGKATIEELRYVDFIHNNLMEPMVKNAQNLRINIEPLKNEVLSYFTRAITPQFRALKKSNKTKYRLVMNQARVALGKANKRTLYTELSIPNINKTMKERFGLKYNIFEENPIKALVQRKTEDIVAINKAAGVLRAVELYAKSGIRGMSESKFLETMGLTSKAIGDLPAIEAGRFIPRDIVQMMKRNNTLFQDFILDEQTMLKTFNVLDKINRPFKILLTSPFPAFHNRNMIGNIWLNMLGGVTNPRQYLKAALILHRRRLWQTDSSFKVTAKEIEFFEEIAKNKVTSKSLFEDLFRGVGSGDAQKTLKILDVEAPIAGFIPKLKKESIPAKIIAATIPGLGQRQLGQFYEDTARLAHYLTKTDEGLLPFEAVRSVNKFLFDYSKLTLDEKNIARPTFLFYTWMRNNIPLQINTIITEPRVAAFYRKLTNLGDRDIPNYLTERGAIRVPGTEESIFGSLGLPIEDINLFNINAADPFFFDQVKRGFQKGAGTLSPALRFGFELMTGETAFSRRPLRSIPTSELLANISPISRFHRVATKVVDSEDSLALKYIDAVTGLRTFRASKLRGKKDTLKRKALVSGKFTRQGFLVIPKFENKKDRDVKKLLKEISAINKKIAGRR